MTMESNTPPIDAEMMMRSGIDSEIENDCKKHVCYFLSPSKDGQQRQGKLGLVVWVEYCN